MEMDMGDAIEIGRELMEASLLLVAPVVVVSLAVGLLISIFQVVTQIQEMSLTFVPKILTVALTLIAFGPWMMVIPSRSSSIFRSRVPRKLRTWIDRILMIASPRC